IRPGLSHLGLSSARRAYGQVRLDPGMLDRTPRASRRPLNLAYLFAQNAARLDVVSFSQGGTVVDPWRAVWGKTSSAEVAVGSRSPEASTNLNGRVRTRIERG